MNRLMILMISALLCSSGCKEEKAEERNWTMNPTAVALSLEELGCSKEDLTSEPVENDFFKQWTIWKVTDGMLPPRTVFIATKRDLAHAISSAIDLGILVNSEPVRLKNEEASLEYAKLCLDLVMPMAYLLETAKDIPGISDEDRMVWQNRIVGPKATRIDGNYRVDVWIWEQGVLSRGSLLIDESGRVDLKLDKAADSIGVIISIE